MKQILKIVPLIMALVVMVGCSPARVPLQKIVLFAPFEGRYSEIGYSALYPARLAFADLNPTHIELVTLDDGGTLDIAVQRAKAIAHDEQIRVVIIQGYLGASDEVLAHLSEKVVIIVGEWGANSGDHIYHLSNPALRKEFTDSTHLITDTITPPFVGGETFGLPSFVKLQPDFQALTFVSSGELPSAEFVERISTSAPHATPPNQLSQLTYDAVSLAILAFNQNAHLSDINYQGISGQITFSNGYWAEAPIYHYGFDANGMISLR